MTNRLIQRIIILGGITIVGILALQSFWTLKTYDLKDEAFHTSVTITLRKVAEKIATFNNSELPKQDLIQRRSSNYYAVNINSVIDANVLENYLITEFSNRSINTEFEYAVYDCASDSLLYGNFCNINFDSGDNDQSSTLPKFDDLIYYFVVKFPSRQSYILSNMWQIIILNAIALLACLFFIYSIYVILKQKKLSILQKDFINNMTHEFKTPISSIKIASEVLVNNELLKSNPRLQQYAQIIRNQNEKLNSQVEKVLNIARSESNGFEIKKSKILLNEFIKNNMKSEMAKLADKKADLKLNLDQACQYIFADPLHLANIFTNVIDNAIKYCENTPNISIQTINTSQFYYCRISDNGIGIPQEHLKAVTGKFFRVPTGNLHNVKGFGLGLFYVQNICNAHGWVLKIDSVENKGTLLSLKIPKISALKN